MKAFNDVRYSRNSVNWIFHFSNFGRHQELCGKCGYPELIFWLYSIMYSRTKATSLSCRKFWNITYLPLDQERTFFLYSINSCKCVLFFLFNFEKRTPFRRVCWWSYWNEVELAGSSIPCMVVVVFTPSGFCKVELYLFISIDIVFKNRFPFFVLVVQSFFGEMNLLGEISRESVAPTYQKLRIWPALNNCWAVW